MSHPLSEAVTLHERAVQRVAAESLTFPRARRHRPLYATPVDLRVRTRTVDPDVWGTAMQLAGGDHLRIQVISVTEVIVWNTREYPR